MKRALVGFIAITLFYGVTPRAVFAEYVLPYPSYMPGNKLYRVTRVIDRFKKPLHFGSISRFKYHLSLADKYLVEAKTLFEYKQYLLAADALMRSDSEIALAASPIHRGRKEGKDMRAFAKKLTEASDIHQLTLKNLKPILPAIFEWTPEKTPATTLKLADLIDTSITLRVSVKNQITGL